MKIALSLAVYAAIVLTVFAYFQNGSIVESVQHLGMYLNGKATE